MAAAVGNDWDSQDLECCAPKVFVKQCRGQKILKSQIHSMVKMDCTYSSCNQSGFMHYECLNELEDQLVKHLLTSVSSRDYNSARIRRYNWNDAKDREQLWKDSGLYGFVYKALRCNCEKGLVRRDLTWPPATYRRPRRKNNSQSQSDGNNLPKLITASNGGGSKIHYVPSVLPTFPASSDLARERGSLPPGAQYVDKKVVLKRGSIVSWNQVSGMIKNLNNPDERPVSFSVEAVQGTAQGLEVGAEVQYSTERRKKKMEVVSLSLVKSVIYQQGVVTHWSPEHLAGIIQTDHSEVIVTRKNFLPGGFVGNIIGKIVKFKEDDEEATCVSVVKEIHYDEKVDLTDVRFTDLELLAAPFLGRIEELDAAFVEEIVLAKSDEEWYDLVSQIFPFLVKVAAHTKGYKVVMLLAENSDGPTKERIVQKIAGSFFALCKTSAGAACILELLGLVRQDREAELQRLILEKYEVLESSQQAEEHLTHPHAMLVFQACVPLLETAALRSLTSHLVSCSVLERLAGHPSLSSLVSRAATEDTHCLYLLMASLDREDRILQEGFSPLISELMKNGGPRCCGVILHNISGKLQSILSTSHGRQITTLLIKFASDLQLYLVLEEMFVGTEENPPPFVELASNLDDGGRILKALVPRLDIDTMGRILALFKQEVFTFRIIQSSIGKFWLNVLSKKVNSAV